jgi:hypothetical protein
VRDEIGFQLEEQMKEAVERSGDRLSGSPKYQRFRNIIAVAVSSF